MATGRQPFDSPNPFTAMMNVMRLDPPPARSLNPAVPEVLSDLIARLLAKKPDDRPRTAREVADAVAAMPVPVEEARETVTFEPPVAPVPIEQFQETATFEPPVAGAEVVAVPRDGPKTPPLSVLRSTVRMPGVAAGVLLTAALVGVGIWAMSRGGTTRDEVPVIPPSPTPTVGGPIGLDPARIPPAERWPGAPAELVGVVGSGVRQHFGGVGMIVVHPEEKWVATLDAARPVRRVRFWDHATLTPAGSVEWDGDSLGQMAVSRDGRSLAVGVQYGPVALYDVSTPAAKLLGRLPAESVTRFAFLPDGSLLTAEPGGRMTVWDLATKQRRRNFTLPPLDFDRDASTRVQDLAVSADGSTLAVNCQNQVIRLWDLSREPPAELDVLHGPDQSWIGAALGADGKTLYTAGFSVREPATTIRAWRVGGNGTQDAGMIARDDANSGYVEFALAPDGKQLAVSTLRSGVLRFDLSGRTPAAVPAPEPRGEDVPAARLGFGRHANTLYTGGTALRAWDLTGTRPTERAPFDASSRVTASALTAESKLVAVHADGKLRVWDLTGPVPTVCRELAPAVTAGQLAVTADGATAIQADGGLTVWPLDAPGPAPVRPGSAGAVADLALTPDGQYLLTSAARALTLWDRRGSDYSPRFNQQAAGGWGRCAVSPDGRWAAAVEFHAGLRLFRAADKELEPALDVPNPAAGAPVFSPDGSVLLVVGKDLARPLRYRLADQKWTAAPFPDRNDYSRIQDAVFGPDGRTIVACGSRVGSQDTRLEVWDADTGTVSRTVALPGRVTELSVSSDGRHVATQNDNGTAYILDLTPGPKD
jgi:WD40 repeat protein